MKRPYLLLDIDGVVLPYGSIQWLEGKHPKHWDEPYLGTRWHDQFFGDQVRAHIPMRIVDALREELSSNFNIVWASLRGGTSTQFEQILDLMGSYPCLDFDFKPGDPYDRQTAKLATIEAWAETIGDTPWAWIDDHCIPYHWREGHHNFTQRVHFEVPDSKVGITPEHVRSLLAWASTAFRVDPIELNADTVEEQRKQNREAAYRFYNG